MSKKPKRSRDKKSNAKPRISDDMIPRLAEQMVAQMMVQGGFQAISQELHSLDHVLPEQECDALIERNLDIDAVVAAALKEPH
jgi:hypothetical protein